MSGVFFLILRRLRGPLITLVVVYAVSLAGLVLIPGADAEGRPWRMGFFHAFYVLSYTATTIGFGEIPYAFTDAQRMWMTFSIYLSVVGWTYTLGAVFALTQDRAFRGALAHNRFVGRVRRLDEPFFIICGYGQSGRQVCRALDRLGFATVVLDDRAERIEQLGLEDWQAPRIALVADARMPRTLSDAGVSKPNCAGLVALGGDDPVNQTIAIAARVLAPDLRVLARTKDRGVQRNLDAFGSVVTVNPFEVFATNFGMALMHPDSLRLEELLTGVPGTRMPARVEAPSGHWVLVGYGRFGWALAEVLTRAGQSWTAIDLDPARCTADGVVGNGLDEAVLRRAGLERAVGILAGTDNDATNLAVTTVARRVAPGLFVAIRQNVAANRSLTEAAHAQIAFVQADLMAHECLQALITPHLNHFLMIARRQPPEWSKTVLEQIVQACEGTVPYLWMLEVDARRLGLRHALRERRVPMLTLSHLLADPDQPGALPATALMLLRDGVEHLLPEPSMPVRAGDRILFAGNASAQRLQRRVVEEDYTMDFVRTGVDALSSPFGRWLAARRSARQPD
ncbi:MAG TPA: NAD-binding protein [Quisquiliibacterium sp.]|nr:NAD-binding protein [Quisquiliibacterium sp.]HQN11539.1 NAD-binding protein [Quisquiliibacterium sp.]